MGKVFRNNCYYSFNRYLEEMLFIWLFCSLLRVIETKGFQSRFISIPPKPTISHSGDNVTFTWRYRLSQTDRSNLKWLVFGEWKNGDISTPLMTVLKNGSHVTNSRRVKWNGNKNAASFNLLSVTIEDDQLYGCKIDFGAFSVLDSVRLRVIAPPRIKKSESHKLKQVQVSLGEAVVMRCDVTGYPIPLIFWTRDGKTVQNATKNGALTINQAQEQMTGIYTCVAQNEVGVDTYDLLLLVTSCKHQNTGVRYHLRGNVHNKHDDSGSSVHPHSTLAPTLAVAFLLIIIFGAYFFFQCMGKRSQKSRNYDRMPQDEQAQNLMGEWSSFKGSGDKI